ncbi:PilN domain-containing protein [Brevibacillus dissolubilis]|uniref:PilN domain-containing protein n=1 Tax=Brevibacillus dissolubilis TaxID=1844116 RepID=UPI0011161395|nr:PilN domain-containing protein [Brevibacillus dissolubilis]
MIDINLLPRKKRSVGSRTFWIIALGSVWLGFAGFTGLSYYQESDSLTLLETQTKQKEQLLQALSENPVQEDEGTLVDQYTVVSKGLHELFYPMPLLLDVLSHNLPKEGKIRGISYELNGRVQVRGEFEQYSDVAAYLYNLENSPYVMKARVKQIVAVKPKVVGEGGVTVTLPAGSASTPTSAATTSPSATAPAPAKSTIGSKLLPRQQAEFELFLNTINGTAAKP